MIVGKLCRFREQHSVHQKFGLESRGGPVFGMFGILGMFVWQPEFQAVTPSNILE